MQEHDMAPRCEVPVLPCDHVRRILDEARIKDGLAARAIEIAILVPQPIRLVAAAPIELIDRDGGFIRLMDDDGCWTELAVSPYAMEAIRAASRGRSTGPLVADGRGHAFRPGPRSDAEVADLMAVLPPTDERDVFGLLLRTGLAHLAAAGVPAEALCLTGPSGWGDDPDRRFRHLEAQASAASIWAGRLALWTRPGSRGDFADCTRDGLRGVGIEDSLLWERAE
ncbi:MAG: hypothetical protein PGN23_06730 [Sphingomonas adhaesiva]|uniref:hypothetical protein n=1 Tax=Sphingomonas adhaesiva TaxID=28212 RepID=UPI002FF4ED26